MNKLPAILSALVAGASISSAEELSVSTTFAWESQYVFRGVGFAEDFFAPAVDVSYGGAYFGIWAALPVDTIYGNEVDYYGGYGFGLSETVSLDLGFTYYTFPDAAEDFFDSDTNTFEIYAGTSFETVLSPSIYLYYDFDLETFTAEGSFGHSFEVSETASIDLSGYLGYVDPDGGDDSTYYGIGTSYNVAVNDAVGFSIFANWAGSSEDTLGLDGVDAMGDFIYDDDNELWFGFSVSAGM